jgi:hypothetical protein
MATDAIGCIKEIFATLHRCRRHIRRNRLASRIVKRASRHGKSNGDDTDSPHKQPPLTAPQQIRFELTPRVSFI